MIFTKYSRFPVLVVALVFLVAEPFLSFDHIPRVFGETINRTSRIYRALERVVEYGEKIEHSGFRTDLFLDLVPSYVEVGDMNRAIAIANRDEITRERILRGICEKQIELGQIEEALNTAVMIEPGFSKAILLREIAQVLVKRQNFVEARNLTSQAIQMGLSDRFSDDMPSLKSRKILDLAEIQWSAHDEKGARLTIQKAIKIAVGEEFFFTDVAELYARMGDKKGILSSVQRIPILDDRNTALMRASKAQAESGDIQGALGTVAMIENTWDKDKALHSIARVQAKVDIHGALKTATTITHHMKYKTFALLHIAEAQEARFNKKTARETLAKAEIVAHAIPDADERAEVFAVIAQIQWKIGATKSAERTIGKALHLIKQIKDSDLPVRALVEIIQAQIKAGDIYGALKSADIMGPSFHNFSVNWWIAEAQALTGDYEGAVATAQKSHPGERGLWRASTLQLVARIQARQGQDREAEKWAEGLDFDTDVAWAFLGIAEGMIAQERKLAED